MSPTVYLVTGASRGIGYTLVEQLSGRPNTVVFAGLRSYPPSADSPLGQLSAKLPEVVFPIQLTSGGEDNVKAAEEVKAKVGKVDVIIANAGVASGMIPVLKITPELLHRDFEINAVSNVVLYQAFSDLLIAANAASPGSAKFVVVSSVAGQITEAMPFPATAYGASKASVNYIVKKIDQEAPGLVAFPIHPGLVDTDMGRTVTESGYTLEQLGAVTPLQSVTGMLAVIDKATKESHGGKFWDFKGEPLTY